MREDPSFSRLQGSRAEASQVEGRAWLLSWLPRALEVPGMSPGHRTSPAPQLSWSGSDWFLPPLWPLCSDVQKQPSFESTALGVSTLAESLCSFHQPHELHQVTESLGDPLAKWGYNVPSKGDCGNQMTAGCEGFSSSA